MTDNKKYKVFFSFGYTIVHAENEEQAKEKAIILNKQSELSMDVLKIAPVDKKQTM